MADRYHKAARDGFLDLLREVTKKEANKADEDGMTPTLWAAYYGNLDALRLVVGRGGDPDRCSYVGNSSLHCAAMRGHLNCVSFLVSFGANLWTLDNDFHTALDLAALNEYTKVVEYLDQVVARQSALNKKVVRRLKQKAVDDAKRRLRDAQRRAEKCRRRAEREQKRSEVSTLDKVVISADGRPAVVVTSDKVRSRSGSDSTTGLYARSLPYSQLVGGTVRSQPAHGTIASKVATKGKRALGGTAKKLASLNQRRSTEGHLKVNSEGQARSGQTVRSLTAGRKSGEVLYVAPSVISAGSTSSGASSSESNGHLYSTISRDQQHSLNDILRAVDNLSRVVSEPDIYYQTDSGYGGCPGDCPGDHLGGCQAGEDASRVAAAEPQSLFERPGFGNVAFRHNVPAGALMSLPGADSGSDSAASSPDSDTEGHTDTGHTDTGHSDTGHTGHSGHTGHTGHSGHTGHTGHKNLSRQPSESISDSIGSLGSLAQRHRDVLPWADQELHLTDDDDLVEDDEVDEEDFDEGEDDSGGGAARQQRRQRRQQRHRQRIRRTSPLETFLASQGLMSLLPALHKEKIDLSALMLCTDTDLREAGLAIGPRKKLLDAVFRRREAMASATMGDHLLKDTAL